MINFGSASKARAYASFGSPGSCLNKRAAGSISRARYARLADEVKRVLIHAITRGGTTLRDFISPDSEPGYFERELFVYGRDGKPCKACGTPIRSITLGQRSTYFCPRCQG